jgi:glycosyltransferase involved in cell wall biosynthesis
MKIVYVITRADEYGGAQVHVRDLSKWMTIHGHDVHVIGGYRGIVSETIEGNGVTFHEAKSLSRSIHPIKDMRAFFQVRKILKTIKPDIVSCHSSKAGIIGRTTARTLKIKSIFTAHGWAFTDGISWKKQYLFRAIEWFMSKIGDHIITVSRYDKVIALKYGVSRAITMSVVHNGMPFRPNNLNKQDNDVPQLCMVARFSEQKDHTTLLNALGMLAHKPWHLNLIGNGDDTAERALAIALGIHDRITFHGQRTDVPDFLDTQDIYLLISHWEGFPRSIIEAMRASLPVITTKTAGSPEAVSQFKTGYIVPERDPEKLLRAINLLISAPLRCHTIGEAGRKRYEQLFTFDEMAYKTLNVYETVLEIERSKHPQTPETFDQTIAPQ